MYYLENIWMTDEIRVMEALTDPGVDLDGKRMLITGSSRGVGAATAELAAKAGADVAINYRSKARRAEQIAEKVRATGRKAAIVEADVTDPDAVSRMFDVVDDELGGLDILVLNASGGLEKDAGEGYAIRLNRDAQFDMAQTAIKHMNPGGVIVFVTSHLAHFHGEKPVVPEYEPVAASKKAGETALRGLMADMQTAGIRFAVVSGDIIDGTITPKLLDRMQPGLIEQRRAEAGGWLPTTDDFAAAIVMAAGRNDLGHGGMVFVGSTEWS